MKSYLSSQLEVAAALSGELSRLFVPVKPQPVISRKLTQFGGGRWGQTYGLKKDAVTWDYDIPVSGGFWASGTENGPWVSPYPPESLVYFREAFTVFEPEHCAGPKGRFAYMADTPKGSEGDSCRLDYIKSGWPYQWIPGSRMPREAARIYAKLGEPLVKRVQEVTEEEAKAMGIGEWEDTWPRDFKVCPKCGGTGTHPALGENNGVTESDCHTCDTRAKRLALHIRKRHPGIEWLWIYPVTVVSINGKPE